jgi:hypothetical protein
MVAGAVAFAASATLSAFVARRLSVPAATGLVCVAWILVAVPLFFLLAG